MTSSVFEKKHRSIFLISSLILSLTGVLIPPRFHLISITYVLCPRQTLDSASRELHFLVCACNVNTLEIKYPGNSKQLWIKNNKLWWVIMEIIIVVIRDFFSPKAKFSCKNENKITKLGLGEFAVHSLNISETLMEALTWYAAQVRDFRDIDTEYIRVFP